MTVSTNKFSNLVYMGANSFLLRVCRRRHQNFSCANIAHMGFTKNISGFTFEKHDKIMGHVVLGGSVLLFGHLGFFDVHQLHGTQVFLRFAPIKMRPPWPGSIPSPQAQIFCIKIAKCISRICFNEIAYGSDNKLET